MTINERVGLIIKMHNLTASAFADQIGVQRSNVSHVLSGRNKPGIDFVEKILLSFPRVNAHWLLTGENEEFTNVINAEAREELIESQASKINSEVMNEGQPIKIVEFYRDGSFRTYLPSVK